MAIRSQVSGFTNIGHDLQISLAGGYGGLSSFIPNVMSLQWKQLTIPLQHVQMDGLPLYAEIPNGYEGTIDFHRQNGDFETEFGAIQTAWLGNQDLVFRTITCNVAGAGGGRFTFTNVTIKMEEGGDWKGDEVTKCRLVFKASRMQ